MEVGGNRRHDQLSNKIVGPNFLGGDGHMQYKCFLRMAIFGLSPDPWIRNPPKYGHLGPIKVRYGLK